MSMHHVDALNIAICKLCFIFPRTARRIRNTRQTMHTPIVQLHNPTLPSPPHTSQLPIRNAFDLSIVWQMFLSLFAVV